MRLRVLLAAALLPLLAVAGCSTLGAIGTAISTAAGFTVTQRQIDAAEAGYGALLVFAVEYRCRYDNAPAGCVVNGQRIPKNACRANEGPSIANGFCAQRSVAVRLQETDKVVQDALDRVQGDYAACTVNRDACSGLGAAYNTLMTALAAARALAHQYGFAG